VATCVRQIARALGHTLLIAALACLTGCGSGKGSGSADKPFPVKGKLLKGGLPLQPNTAGLPPGDPGLQVIFYRLGGAQAGEEYRAEVNAQNGTFELLGFDGKGIPKGRYRIAVIMAPVGGVDQFKGKYDKEHSKVEKEITGKEDDLVVDIEKPNG
jgi:hypothetical protein